jgi:hypothetical protein
VYRFVPLVWLLFLSLSLGALDRPIREIEDDSNFRASLLNSWFTEPPARTLNRRPLAHTLSGGGRIEVRAEPGQGDFMVILARELQNTPEAFPGWAQGSWILTRRRDTGDPVRIRIFPRSDPYTYIQFRPMGDKIQMDAVVYDGYVIRSLPLALSFDRLLVMPLEEVLGAAGDKFPRRYFEPKIDDYRDLRAFIARVRERLPELRFRDDGAIDERGRYVFINTLAEQEGDPGLNCSGFAKWIVDGILRPLTGSRLAVAPLKQPAGSRGSSFTEAYEALRDPFFGLDWTRNLAAAAAAAIRSPAALEEIEVRRNHFASVIVREQIRGRTASSVRSYPGFLPNAGFGIEGIHPLLYTLAIDEPGHIYLASVNNEIDPAPRMRQHFHIAVLVPYFNEYGNFQVAIFESAEETSFSAFKTRYPGHYVNLVRIASEGTFDP